MEALLSCRNLIFSFAHQGVSAPSYVLCDVSLDVYAGEIVGLVGESGCGKSTLARVLMGLLKPVFGCVLYRGESLYAARSKKAQRSFLQHFYRHVRMIFQDPYASLDPRMSILTSLLEPLQCLFPEYSRKKAQQECLDMLKRVGIEPEYAKRYPHEFSGGQRQRITIARALLGRPECLICDEPSSALDVSIQAQILNILLDLRDDFNVSCLCISHDLAVIEQLSSRIGVMYAGRLLEEFARGSLNSERHHPYTQSLLSASLLEDIQEPFFMPKVEEASEDVLLKTQKSVLKEDMAVGKDDVAFHIEGMDVRKKDLEKIVKQKVVGSMEAVGEGDGIEKSAIEKKEACQGLGERALERNDLNVNTSGFFIDKGMKENLLMEASLVRLQDDTQIAAQLSSLSKEPVPASLEKDSPYRDRVELLCVYRAQCPHQRGACAALCPSLSPVLKGLTEEHRIRCLYFTSFTAN